MKSAVRLCVAAVAVSLLSIAQAQSPVATNSILATQYGNLVLNGYSIINYDSSGIASTTTNDGVGALYTLNPNGGFYSPFISNAACAYVGFSSNFSSVTAFVTTKSNLQSMLNNGTLDYSKAAPVSSARWTNQQSGTAIFNLNSQETYVFIVINTGGQGQNGGSTSSTQLGYRFAAYDKSSTVCQTAVGTGSTDFVRQNPSFVPYIAEDTTLNFKETRPFAFINAASCISFQLSPQARGFSGGLDLTFLVNSVSSSVNWINQKFPLPVPYVGRAVYQQSSATGSTPVSVITNSSLSTAAGDSLTVSPSQAGQVNIDGLNPQAQYILWGINGQNSANGSSANALIKYAARSTGSCAGIRFPDPSSPNYLGSAGTIFLARNTGGVPSTTPASSTTPSSTAGSSPTATPATPGTSSTPTPAATTPGAGSGGSGGIGGAGGANGGGSGGCGGGGGSGGTGSGSGNGGSGGGGGAGGLNLGGGSGGCGGNGGSGGSGAGAGNGGSGGPGGAGGSGPAGAGGGAGGGGGGGGGNGNSTGTSGSGGSGGPGGAGGSTNGGTGGSGGGGGSGGVALGSAPAGQGASGGVGGAGGNGTSTATGGGGGAGGLGGSGGNSLGPTAGGNGGSGGGGGSGGAAGAGPGGAPGGAGGAGGVGGAGGSAGRRLRTFPLWK